jgi:hypothetical protein
VIKEKVFLYSLFLILLFLSVGKVNGQILETDTTLTTEVSEQAEKIHSPKKAAIFSAVLPGLGQAYNKKYWKIPIVYAGFGAIGYFIGWNNNNYQTLKLAYSDFTDGDDSTNSYLDLEGSKYYDLESPSGQNEFKTALNKQQEYYRRNRDLLIISIVGFYGLNIIDASVDAHLFDFDISEDLTFDWQPALRNVDEQLVYGFNCRFSF